MTTKITADNIEQSTLDILGGSGPAIANVKITSNTYTILDDTAVSTDGGYIIVNGSNFEPNVNILLDGTAATSVTRVSSTQLQAEIPALSAGSKILYVVNTDTGSTTILLNGVTYSGTPTWVTASSLDDQIANISISIQLSATSDSNVIYQLQTGSSLPTGLTLAANGLLSGTVTVANDTLYNFTIEATDVENQESPRSFSVSIIVPDEYFRYTTLLLNGDGTSGANNNVFVDSSDNNFPISCVADAGQGSFAPFSTPDGRWSVYLMGQTH
jgi:large repetitive protein